MYRRGGEFSRPWHDVKVAEDERQYLWWEKTLEITNDSKDGASHSAFEGTGGLK